MNAEDDEEGNQEVVGGDTPHGTTQHKTGGASQRQASQPVTTITRMSPTTQHNWQANYTGVVERNRVMFNNPFMADVHFTVGQQPNKLRIPAHKYVLATGSSVFYAMFYGGLATRDGDIEIPDVEPPAFLSLLRYGMNGVAF